MTIHKVKSWTHLFRPIQDGRKTHDLRKLSDRDYQVGDILQLQEFDMIIGKYTGDEVSAEITYITSLNTPCALSSNALDRDHCILSIKLLDK